MYEAIWKIVVKHMDRRDNNKIFAYVHRHTLRMKAKLNIFT